MKIIMCVIVLMILTGCSNEKDVKMLKEFVKNCESDISVKINFNAFGKSGEFGCDSMNKKFLLEN